MDRRAYGDFQTPPGLAAAVCRRLAASGWAPRTLIEPTCGTGAFVLAALDHFPTLECGLAVDRNPAAIAALSSGLAARRETRIDVRTADFFSFPWAETLAGRPEPLLVLGNPPWVTSSTLGSLDSANLPPKRNASRLAGIDALTGKSNFDISAWMVLHLAEALVGRQAALAVLVKTAVARYLLRDAPPGAAALWEINARRWFGVSAPAGLFTLDLARPAGDCPVFPTLDAEEPVSTLGRRDGWWLADTVRYERRRHLLAAPAARVWRSGIKHDASAVMELTPVPGGWRNGLGERADVDADTLFPLFKSADVARGRTEPRRWLLMPQRTAGADTAPLRLEAPRTWAYLEAHAARLDARPSRIWRVAPRFAVFGLGPYSFADWKVAVSALYKEPVFRAVGPFGGRPVIFDDTVYLRPCASEAEARGLAEQLNGEAARDFLAAFSFRDAKRPLTAELLNRLDVRKL